LAAGGRLPSTRDMAAQLGLSRNTVAGAYDRLRAEGYTRAVTGSGTFITDPIPEGLQEPFAHDVPQVAPNSQEGASALSARGRAMLQGGHEAKKAFGAFVPGAPDLTQFPRRKFSALVAKWWRRAPPEALSYAPG